MVVFVFVFVRVWVWLRMRVQTRVCACVCVRVYVRVRAHAPLHAPCPVPHPAAPTPLRRRRCDPAALGGASVWERVCRLKAPIVEPRDAASFPAAIQVGPRRPRPPPLAGRHAMRVPARADPCFPRPLWPLLAAWPLPAGACAHTPLTFPLNTGCCARSHIYVWRDVCGAVQRRGDAGPHQLPQLADRLRPPPACRPSSASRFAPLVPRTPSPTAAG